jgi:hypothetical protein
MRQSQIERTQLLGLKIPLLSTVSSYIALSSQTSLTYFTTHVFRHPTNLITSEIPQCIVMSTLGIRKAVWVFFPPLSTA